MLVPVTIKVTNPGPNASGTTNGVPAAVTGWIVSAFAVIPPGGVPHGRYYLDVELGVSQAGGVTPSVLQFRARIMRGYLTGARSLFSQPNIKILAGEMIYCVLTAASLANINDEIDVNLTIETDPSQVSGLSGQVFDELPGTGIGEQRLISIGNPAAGSDLARQVPVQVRWRFHGIVFTLTASAAAANRIMKLVVQDSTQTFDVLETGPGVTQTANQVKIYSAAPGNVLMTTQNPVQWSFPENYLPSASFIKTVTAAIDAADQYSAIGLMVEEWALPIGQT